MAKTFKSSFNFALLWSVLVAISTIVGFALAQFLAGKFFNQRDYDDYDFAIALFLYILVIGFFIGTSQWIVLKIQLRKIWRWVPATAIGYPMGVFVSLFILSMLENKFARLGEQFYDVYTKIKPFAIFMLTGMFTGAMQWFALGRKLTTSIKWVLVSGLGFMLGCLFILVPDNVHHTNRLVGIMGVIGFGLLTGVFASLLVVSPEMKNE